MQLRIYRGFMAHRSTSRVAHGVVVFIFVTGLSPHLLLLFMYVSDLPPPPPEDRPNLVLSNEQRRAPSSWRQLGTVSPGRFVSLAWLGV